ncbi:MAG: hypothetical protein R3300_08100 [Candidatus Promineifilaceae bacterium]|nr:hypothetical protein [Candidatus Promineifilaceae bacterium]
MEHVDGRSPWTQLLALVALLAALLLAGGQTRLWERPMAEAARAAAANGAYVKRSSSAIAVTVAGNRVLAVNPDSDSLSLINLHDGLSVIEIAVGDDPRTVAVSDDGRRAYTANRGDNSVSVVDLAAAQVIGHVAVGARPYGVVLSPDGRTLYVTEQGHDRLAVIDTAALRRTMTVPLPDRPSGLALSDDGRTLYITHLLSGAISALTLPPPRVHLPLVARPADSPAAPASPRPAAAGAAGMTTGAISLWSDSNLVQAFVIAPTGQRAVVPHTRANSSNTALTLSTTVFPVVSLVDLLAGRHLLGQQFNLDILDPPAVGLPFDAAFTPDGATLWLVNAASNDVTVIDLEARDRLAHIEVGPNPRGVVISPDGSQAFVNNTLAGSVSIIDTATYTVTAVIPVTSIPLDPLLLSGKRLFHSSDDPRLGQDQWMSCNTCHFDGEHDGRTWQLGFAGPRNTTGLLGLEGTLPLRWSGEWDEAADAEFAIRKDSFGTGLVEGELRCSLDPPDCANHPPHAGLSAELDALAAYISSLAPPLSPDRALGRPLPPAAVRGEAHYNDASLGCADCHPPPLYTDNQSHDVGTATADERIGPAFNTPSLRGLYDSPPYFHDGSAATLYEAVTRLGGAGQHDVSGRLSPSEIEELLAFLLALPFEP